MTCVISDFPKKKVFVALEKNEVLPGPDALAGPRYVHAPFLSVSCSSFERTVGESLKNVFLPWSRARASCTQ